MSSHPASQNASLVGQPIHFVSGQFAGQTVRAQLDEIQKADLGRKYARVDRRPLDPPPVVLLRLFRVYDQGTDHQTEKEITNYDAVESHGLVCTVDLFPVYSHDDSSSSSRKDPRTPRRHSSGSSRSVLEKSQQQTFTFVTANPYASSSLLPMAAGTVAPPQPVSAIGSATALTRQTPSSSSHGHASSSSSTPSDIVWKIGNYQIPESSKLTHALVGATFVQPANVDYQGRKSLMFVFADLAVKLQGTFILRYRFFDIFAQANTVRDLVIQAECYGGAFRVYSNKEFPGLQASTELTKQLARWGVRLNIRETERKRRKKGERKSASPSSPTTRQRRPVLGDRHHSDEEDASDDESLHDMT